MLWEEKYLHPLLPNLINTKTTPSLIFLRGISGSGKSTVSKFLRDALGPSNTVICSADNYFIKDSVYKFDITKVSEAHKDCLESMEAALQTPEIRYIIVDNTHTRLWHLQAAERTVQKYGAHIHYIDINVPDLAHLLVCLVRQQHNVSKETLLEQWTNWEIHPKSISIPMQIS